MSSVTVEWLLDGALLIKTIYNSFLCNQWIKWTSTGHLLKPDTSASECAVVVKSTSENMTVIPGIKTNRLR